MDISQVYDEYVRPLPLADRLRLAERIVAQAAVEATGTQSAAPVPAAQPLGRRLRELRARIEQTGGPLLDEDAMRAELAARRGGAEAWDQAEHADLR